MDITLAKHNLNVLFEDSSFKTNLLNTLNILEENNKLTNKALALSQKNAKTEKINSFFKKAGGLLVGGGLAVVGGTLLLSGTAPLIGAALAVSAALPYGKTISDMMSPNAKLYKQENQVELAQRDAGISEVYLKNISDLAMDVAISGMKKSPDTEQKMKTLLEQMKSVELASDFINASNYRSKEQISNHESQKPSMIDKFRSRIKALNSNETDMKSENKFKLK